MDGAERTSTNPQAPLEGSARSRTGRRGALAREILALAIPALGALVAEPLFTLIDSAMVGHLGTAPLAGLSLASQILQTLVALFVFLAYSTTSLTARALGAGDRAGAIREGVNASWLAAGLGLLGAFALFLAAPAAAGLMTSDAAVAGEAVAYLRASAPGLVGMLLGFSTVGTLRGLQDTRTPLLVTGVGAIANVGINAALMYGLGMGVAGSGLGTSIVQLLMAGVYLTILRAEARRCGAALRPSGTGVLRSALDGAPLVVRGLALGRGARSELRELLRVLTIWGTGAGLVLGVVVAASSPWLPLVFGASSAVRPVAAWGLVACCVGMPLGGVVFMLDGVLLGAGDNRYFAVAGVVQLLVYLPALALVELARVRGRGPVAVVVGVWAAYGLVYMGARLATNARRTWGSHSRLLAG